MFKSKLKRKKDISLKCNPPVDCFTCTKKDCTASSGSKRTDLELKYLQNVGFDGYQKHNFKR